MEKHYKHCIIDFKNKIIKTYNTNTLFTYDKFEHKYLIDVTMTHTDEGIRILGTQIYRCYTDKPIKLSDINGVVPKRFIKKSSIFKKLEKWLGYDEYEYVEGEYFVKFNNDVTIFNIPKNILDMFIFEHTTNKESQE
jgi:hypothetical protein